MNDHQTGENSGARAGETLDLKRAILMGMETEYSIIMFDESGEPFSPNVTEQIVRCFLQSELQNRSVAFLESHGGYAGPAGQRIYWDRLGNVSAAEYSTPECRDPLEVVSHHLAGNQFYVDLAQRMECEGAATAVEVYLPGVCWSTNRANGIHFNYFRCRDKPITELAAHLASLPCITGCGGWRLNPDASLEFVRSPRAELIGAFISSDSSHARPLIDSYNKKYGIGRRVQDLSGDPTHSAAQLYVRLGSTALLLAMVDLWNLDLSSFELDDPVAAMKTWNRCPWEPVATATGDLTALDLQWRLWGLVKSALEKPLGEFPSWCSSVVAVWEQLLLAAADEQADDRQLLDWALHESVLRYACQQRGIAWEWLPTLASAYEQFVAIQEKDSELNEPDGYRTKQVRQRAKVEAVLRAQQIEWETFLYAIRELRPLLHLTSTEFLRLGTEGSAKIRESTQSFLPQLTKEMIASARVHPPLDTRARVRGAFVRKYAGVAEARANWDVLVCPDGSRIAIPDPFDSTVRIASWENNRAV